MLLFDGCHNCIGKIGDGVCGFGRVLGRERANGEQLELYRSQPECPDHEAGECRWMKHVMEKPLEMDVLGW